MRVGYELTGLELDRTGTARAIERLRSELERHPAVELVPLAHPGRPRRGAGGRIIRGLSRELAYLPLALPRRAAALGLDVLHCPVGLAPVRSSVPTVVSAHDVMALEHPEWFTRGNALQQRLVLGRALRRAALVLTPSEFTRARVVERLGLDPARVRVIPWGIDERFSPGGRPDSLLERLGVPGAYLLTVGTLQPRKNLEAALRAFEKLAAGGGTDEHRLVVAGARGWSDAELVRRVERSPVRRRIHLTGRVTDEELVGLYRGAACLVFPSRYEGFGFPPLEAMACGTPVVASDRTSLPEVLGDAAVLCDPDDAEALAGGVAAILSSPERRRELVGRGRQRAAGFTWSRCARLTVSAYRSASVRAV